MLTISFAQSSFSARFSNGVGGVGRGLVGAIGLMDGQEEDGGVGGGKRGEIVHYSDYSLGGGGGWGRECTYVYHCLQKKKCDWNLFCRCHRGKCVSMRTSRAIGKRDCNIKQQVRAYFFSFIKSSWVEHN